MPGQTLRFAAFARDHVRVDVPRVLRAEGDPLSVGREMRIGGLSLKAGQAPRRAAGPLDDPNIVGVSESNLRGANGGSPQHARPRDAPTGCFGLKAGAE